MVYRDWSRIFRGGNRFFSSDGNVYLHELDWYAKHVLHIPYYLRYNDDMIIIATDRQKVVEWSSAIQQFVARHLRLTIPPHKVSCTGLPQAVDILGFVTNGERVWIRRRTAQRAQEQMAMKYHALATEFLDTVSSYYGSGIPHSFPILTL